MDWIAVTEAEGRALADAARLDLTAPVAACPGWDVQELLRHVGFVHQRTGLVVAERRQERPTVEAGTLPEAPQVDVLPWYEATHATLVEVLRSTDPATEVWTFHPDHHTAAFWPRRMAHETTVHRVDAQRATGVTQTPITVETALDGIGEMLDVFLPFRHASTATGDGETVHLHATDGDGEWLVTLLPQGVRVEQGHAKGDAAVRGPAADLYLWVWGRTPLDELEVFGDVALAARLGTLTQI